MSSHPRNPGIFVDLGMVYLIEECHRQKWITELPSSQRTQCRNKVKPATLSLMMSHDFCPRTRDFKQSY